jgi:hypothetical protein
LLQHLHECRDAGLSFRIVRGRSHEDAYAAQPFGLLRSRGERPRHRRRRSGPQSTVTIIAFAH